jgi:hypothetical protein
MIIENNISYVLVNERIPYEVTGSSKLYPAPFLRQMHNIDDNIYDNGLLGVWTVK